MNARQLLLISYAMLIISCSKNDSPPQKPTPPDPPAADIPAVKLKDQSVEKIPSPNYHFNYNDSGYITQVVYASGLVSYDVSYSGKKIKTIETNKDVPFDINKDKLEYEYTNGDATLVKVIDKTGVLYRRCLLVFSATHQLQKLTWELNLGTGFAKEQSLDFTYYTDNNLKEIVYHDFAVGPQLERTFTERFENYDNKINPDGFAWLHTTNHHPILLPSVRLQLNNPGKDIRTGVGVLTYNASYNYTYDAAGRPTVKTGPVTFVDNNGTSGQFQSTTTYTYY